MPLRVLNDDKAYPAIVSSWGMAALGRCQFLPPPTSTTRETPSLVLKKSFSSRLKFSLGFGAALVIRIKNLKGLSSFLFFTMLHLEQ